MPGLWWREAAVRPAAAVPGPGSSRVPPGYDDPRPRSSRTRSEATRHPQPDARRRAGGAARSGPQPPLRLTRRGRIVVVALASALLGLVFSLVLVTSSQAFTGVPVSYRTHVVRPGETLWEIAHDVAPEADTRDTIRGLMTLNDLDTVTLMPGQELQLP